MCDRLLRAHVQDKRVRHLVGDMLTIGQADDESGCDSAAFYSDIRKIILMHGRLSRVRQALTDLPFTHHRLSVFLDEYSDDDEEY